MSIKALHYLSCTVFSLACLAGCHKKRTRAKANKTQVMSQQKKAVIYGFTFTDINGQPYDFSKLRGKKLMIVNTASECGFTPQYKKLEELYETYKDSGFVVIGFPANDFGGQEPGSNAQIKQFCKSNFGVTFPMMEKSTVKGSGKNEVYRFLTEKSRNGVMDSEVKWNFQKYLINPDGTLAAVYPSGVEPDDERIVNWIAQ